MQILEWREKPSVVSRGSKYFLLLRTLGGDGGGQPETENLQEQEPHEHQSGLKPFVCSNQTYYPLTCPEQS